MFEAIITTQNWRWFKNIYVNQIRKHTFRGMRLFFFLFDEYKLEILLNMNFLREAEYELFESFAMTQQGNRIQVYRLRDNALALDHAAVQLTKLTFHHHKSHTPNNDVKTASVMGWRFMFINAKLIGKKQYQKYIERNILINSNRKKMFVNYLVSACI